MALNEKDEETVNNGVIDNEDDLEIEWVTLEHILDEIEGVGERVPLIEPDNDGDVLTLNVIVEEAQNETV